MLQVCVPASRQRLDRMRVEEFRLLDRFALIVSVDHFLYAHSHFQVSHRPAHLSVSADPELFILCRIPTLPVRSFSLHIHKMTLVELLLSLDFSYILSLKLKPALWFLLILAKIVTALL